MTPLLPTQIPNGMDGGWNRNVSFTNADAQLKYGEPRRSSWEPARHPPSCWHSWVNADPPPQAPFLRGSGKHSTAAFCRLRIPSSSLQLTHQPGLSAGGVKWGKGTGELPVEASQEPHLSSGGHAPLPYD